MATAAPIAATPDPEQAYAVLYHRVHVPVFFNKLAEHGIRPQNEGEARELLSIGGKLLAAEEAQHVKAASANGTLLSQINAELDTILGQAGVAVAGDQRTKTAAAQAALDPELAAASLVLQKRAQDALAGQGGTNRISGILG